MALEPRAKFLITADGSDYKRKLAAARKDTETFAGSVRTTLRAGAIAGAAAVTATSVALLRLASEAAKAADALDEQAAVLGISTQKLAAYQLAARMSGSSNEGFEKGLRKLQKSIVDATNGMTTYTRAFEALQLDPAELKELTPDKQFEALAKSFAGVKTQAERVAIAYDLFGGRNTALLNTLLLTGKELNKLESDTKAWGVAISRVDATQISNAEDAAERASTAMQGIGTRIAIAIAPIREHFANAFADSAAEAQGFQSQIDATMRALVVAANFAANSVRGIALALLTAKLAALEVQEEIKEKTDGAGIFQVLAGRGGGIAHAVTPAEDRAASLKKTREEIDATAEAMGKLLGKFQSGDQALAKFDALIADAAARAAAAAAPAPVDPEGGDVPFDLFGEGEKEQLAQRLKSVQDSLLTETEAFRQAQAEREAIVQEAYERELVGKLERDELNIQLAQQSADKVLAIERRTAEQRAELERRLQSQVTQYREAALQSGIALLHTFGSKNRAFAIAAIAFEKAMAVTKILISTRVAAAAALEPPPIGLGPVAGAALAASILASGYVSAALTTALGVAQIANVGRGSTGTTLGTTTNPVFTNDGTRDDPQPVRHVTEVHIQGGVILQEQLVKVMRDAVDADEVFIYATSRQAAEIRKGST